MKTALRFQMVSVIFIVVVTTNLWSQWTQQTFPAKEELYKIRFVNETTGWVLGKNFVYKTSDGGANWEPQDSTFGGGYALCPINDDLVFYANYSYSKKPATRGLRRTKDGGKSWETVDSKECYYSEIEFVSDQIGFAAGCDTNSKGLIQKTTDGGTTWSIVADSFSPSHYELTGISFIDDQTGWAVSYDGYVFHTTTGGQKWSFLDSIRVPFSVSFLPIRDIEFVSQDHGWAVGGISGTMIIASTVTGGKNWTIPDTTGSSLQEVTFLNNKTGWICGQANTFPFIAMTTDGGLSWQDQTPKNLNLTGIKSIAIINENTGWAIGSIHGVRISIILKLANPVAVKNKHDDIMVLPGRIILEPSYPNPFNLATRINYKILEPSHVVLKIYNLKGDEIKTLMDDYQQSGVKSVIWDGRDNRGRLVVSGVYICKIESNNFYQTGKMIVLK